MTDLERARDLRRSLEAAIHPAMRDCFEKCVAHLLAAARREGAEAGLRAALPADPPHELIEAMVYEHTGDRWIHGDAGHVARIHYRALRAHLLGEDA